jgi:hypothetical protein
MSPGFGPPEPVFAPELQALPGHPFVNFESHPDGAGGWLIYCECVACRKTETRNCEFPPKSGHWIAKFAAWHAHGNQAVYAAWAREVNDGLYRLRAAFPGSE